MTTTRGHALSAAMTNCGPYGWVSDQRGYRYEAQDPSLNRPWPAMPAVLMDLAVTAAEQAGFLGYQPDSCLINRYQPGAKMGLHQDRDEVDLSAPIVSVSLGLPIQFKWGGLKRSDPCEKIKLSHGDVLVFGGADRLKYHGVLTLKAGEHELTGPFRYNLTFRKAK